MPTIKRQLLICSAVCALSLAQLGGCATQTHQDVGAVVVAPKPKLQPPTDLVQKTEPKPAGYFQQSLVDYFSGSPPKPTK